MDFDFGINNNEEKPLFNSVANGMTSMKEATAEKIYRRIQKEGMTKYSKPQVDRALAKALNYGIFELRTNNLRVTDNILDDEDTIYWRAQIKQEESSSRLQGRDYINPEKDRRRFRRLSVFDNCRRISDKKRKPNSGKTRNKRNIRFKTTDESNGKIKKNNRRNTRRDGASAKDDKKIKNKSSKKKGSKLPKSKRKEKRMPQRIIRELTLKDGKKITRDPKGTYDLNAKTHYEKFYSEDESNTDSLSTVETDNDYIDNCDNYKITCDGNKYYVKQGTCHENKDEMYYDSDPDDDMSYDEDDQCECECECECESDEYNDMESDSRTSKYEERRGEHDCSSFFDDTRHSITSNIMLSTVNGTSKNTLKKNADDKNSENRLGLKQHSLHEGKNWDSLCKKSNWDIDNRPIENNLLSEGCGNTDWMGHNSGNENDREIKQYDNALRIEPIDLLPFKNIGEASYIS